MPGIRKLILEQNFNNIRTAEVIGRNRDGTYLVKDGRREINVRSAFPDTLSVGSRIVLNQTTTGTFVVGQERQVFGTITEVNVNG